MASRLILPIAGEQAGFGSEGFRQNPEVANLAVMREIGIDGVDARTARRRDLRLPVIEQAHIAAAIAYENDLLRRQGEAARVCLRLARARICGRY